jgi:hypothetical protein
MVDRGRCQLTSEASSVASSRRALRAQAGGDLPEVVALRLIEHYSWQKSACSEQTGSGREGGVEHHISAINSSRYVRS